MAAWSKGDSDFWFIQYCGSTPHWIHRSLHSVILIFSSVFQWDCWSYRFKDKSLPPSFLQPPATESPLFCIYHFPSPFFIKGPGVAAANQRSASILWVQLGGFPSFSRGSVCRPLGLSSWAAEAKQPPRRGFVVVYFILGLFSGFVIWPWVGNWLEQGGRARQPISTRLL